jgi:hypothetical protein
MISRQQENTAKFLYDMAKGVGLIAVIGGFISGQVTGLGVALGLVSMAALFILAYWLDGKVNR